MSAKLETALGVAAALLLLFSTMLDARLTAGLAVVLAVVALLVNWRARRAASGK